MFTDVRPELTVVVPCFNEKENIRPLVKLLEETLKEIHWEVYFVDDDSPDGTSAEVANLALENAHVHLLKRVGRRGLSGACIEGALSSLGKYVAVMDADLQHDESKLIEMLNLHRHDEKLDLVVGSRKVEGGSSSGGLSKIREMGSDIAIKMARSFLRITVADPMSGFFMVKRTSFNQVVTQLQPQGFKILADMLSAAKGTWKVKEVGFQFRSRQFGESKMDSAVTLQYLGLLVSRLTGGFLPIRFVLFGLVGLTGVFVQLASVFILLELFGFPFYISQAVGVWVAMTTNFTFNNMLTFSDSKLSGYRWLKGLISFYLVCLLGAFINVAVAEWLFAMSFNWVIASAVGALFGAVWNFFLSSIITWKSR